MPLSPAPSHRVVAALLIAGLAGAAEPRWAHAADNQPSSFLPAELKVVHFPGGFHAASSDGRFRAVDTSEGNCSYYPTEGAAMIRKRIIEAKGGRASISRTEPVPLNWNWRFCYFIGRIELREAATDRVLAVLRGHTRPLQHMAFSPDSRLLVAASKDDTVAFWDTATRKEIRRINIRYPDGGIFTSYGPIAFSPDSRFLAAAHGANRIVMHDLRSLDLLWSKSDSQRRLRLVTHLLYSPDSRTLATGSVLLISVRDAATGEEISLIRAGNGERFLDMTYTPDGRQLVTAMHAANRRTVVWWDVRTGRQVKTLAENQRMTTAVLYSADGRWLITGGDEMVIRVRDAATLAELRRYEYPRRTWTSGQLEHFTVIRKLRFSPDGRTLYAGFPAFTLPVKSP